MDTSLYLVIHLGVNNINTIVTPLRLLELFFEDTVKPLNSGHLRVLKIFSVIERCPLFGKRPLLSHLELNQFTVNHTNTSIFNI